MGVAERKARDKEELRQLILSAAMRLFAEKGVSNITIRNIADAAEYSIGTVYVYFKDKNAILHALHTQGFTELRNRFQVLMHVGDPMERLKAAGRVYIQFAQEQPDMYNLMFSVEAPIEVVENSPDGKWHEGQATFGFVQQIVTDCMESDHFKGHDPLALAFLVWGTVHGMCTLAVTKRDTVTGLPNPVEQGYTEFLRIIDQL
jgi:AcrR family transcriptional regulator